MNCTLPRKPHTSFSILGGGISSMALILEGATSMPPCVIKKPSIFPTVLPKVHFYGFNLSLYCLII